MSCTCRVAAAGTLLALAVREIVHDVTSSPRASSASTTCEPMNPAPPVTRARIAVIYPEMFITFEGLDGSGKTTQARLLGAGSRPRASRSSHPGAGRHTTGRGDPRPRAPRRRRRTVGGGSALRRLARPARGAADPAGARAGATVISDRYVDSSVAYQGIARGLGLERVLELNLAAVEGLMPDRTILLEIRADDAVGANGRGARPDRARGRRLPRAGGPCLPAARRARRRSGS